MACFVALLQIILLMLLEIVLKPIRFVLITLVVLTLSACATKPPEPVVDFAPDYNFSELKAVGFYAMSGEIGRAHV